MYGPSESFKGPCSSLFQSVTLHLWRPLARLCRELDWSAEEVYRLITLDGMAAKPEAHQAFIENPLVPVDYVTVRGRAAEGKGGTERRGRVPLSRGCG